jgi:outer membrane protein assembly factor BamA
MNRVSFLVLSLLFLVAFPAASQRQSAARPSAVNASKLIALKVTGTSRYTDKEILAAGGLQIGQNAADADFKEAVQRLGDSGLFSNVAYSFSSSPSGTRLEIQLADTNSSKLVPAHFENFVWLTDDELRTALQSRVPLFKELLPLGGSLPDRVNQALQGILAEKQFPGHVSYLREGDENGGPLSAVVYRVEEVSIRIRGVEFPGASSEQTELLTKAGHNLKGAEYSRSTLAATAKFDLLPVYLQRGYLKAAFGPSDARVVPESSPPADAQSATDVSVDAIVPVTPGKIYSTSGVDWKGNSVITTAQLAPLIHLPTAQPADAVRLLLDLEKVTKLYRSRGYITVKIKPDAHFDEDKSAVHYDLNVAEGDQYKMGELEITGLDSQTRTRMVEAWTLTEGKPYDADYPNKFLEDTRRILPGDVSWSAAVHESPDVKEKIVDVEIRFKQR